MSKHNYDGLTNPFDTPERKAFRETIENFVDTEIRPHAHDWDEAGHVPWELHEKLGALGVQPSHALF